MSKPYVEVHNETTLGTPGEWCLYFQFCTYHFSDETSDIEDGYRFIWRRDNGNLEPARGQARIPSIADMFALVSKAIEEGWGGKVGPHSLVKRS